jgi:hypothetical protein|tara:strand:+ start:368 stop:574 length:207 start_codon:yes stop_codon:yes gene_type:complete
MKKPFLSTKKKSISRYLLEDNSLKTPKSTDINILLNRVKINQKLESRKKIIFLVSALTGLSLFGIILF